MSIYPRHLSSPHINGVRPKEVTIAFVLLVSSLGLGLLQLALLPQAGSLWFSLVIIAILFRMVVAIGHGVHWARVVFLLTFLLGIPIFYYVREALIKQGLVSMAIFALQALLQGVGVVLLF